MATSSRSRTSAATAPLNVGTMAPGLPMFRQPEDPSSPQERLGEGPAGQTQDPGTLGAQSSPQSPGLWTPSGATPPPGSGLGDEPDSGPGWSEDEPAAPSEPASSESRGSSPTSSPAEIRATRKALKPVIGQTVVMTTTFAHQGLARDDFEQAVGLYLADEDDVENIADPAAGLLSRRVGGGVANPDLADGIGLLFALAGYVAKQLAKLTEARRLKARQLVYEAENGNHGTEESAPGWPMQSPPPQSAPTQGAA